MIKEISNAIVSYLLKEDVIENMDDDKEYYQYGIEITISSLLNIALILIVGVIFQSLAESIVFLLCFILIRQYTGGFHASSYLRCNLSFCLCFTLLILCYQLTKEYINTYIAILISFICTLVIFSRCPIENPNKPITENRKRFHRLIATLISILYSIISVTLMYFSNQYGVLILYTLLLVTVLIIIAIFKEWRCKYERGKKS